MLILWRLVHTFGFIAWFVGLLGTTAAQVGVRRAPDAESRRAAWAVMKRLAPYELIGLILTPLGGILLTTTTYGHLFKGSPPFVHIKLLLVIIAVICNLLLISMRKKAEAQLGDAVAIGGTLKKMAALQGVATLMLPLAVLAVIIYKYRIPG